MGEDPEPRESSLTMAAYLGAVMAVFAIPAAFWFGVPLIGSGGLFLVTVLALVLVVVLLLMAIAGLTSEVDDLRRALRRGQGSREDVGGVESEPGES